MREERFTMAFDKAEQNLLLLALNDKKTQQMQEGTPTDTVDDLILKTAYAGKRKIRMLGESEHCHEDR